MGSWVNPIYPAIYTNFLAPYESLSPSSDNSIQVTHMKRVITSILIDEILKAEGTRGKFITKKYDDLSGYSFTSYGVTPEYHIAKRTTLLNV